MVRLRLVGLAIGTLYGLGLGFTTLMMTGGGHGNFFWPALFFVTTLFGLIYPALGFLIFDLRSILAKSALIAILVTDSLLFAMVLNSEIVRANSSPNDTLTFAIDPIGSSIFIFFFVWPQILSLILLIRSFMVGGIDGTDE
ncbi:MAG: hypothetical protein AB7J13_14585 [Pyrinomonadaceae bacterium]